MAATKASVSAAVAAASPSRSSERRALTGGWRPSRTTRSGTRACSIQWTAVAVRVGMGGLGARAPCLLTPPPALRITRSGRRRRRLQAALEQARRVGARAKGSERVGGPAPPDRVGAREQRRIDSQRRQLLEEERERQPVAEHGGRKRFDRAVAVQEPRGADRADPFDSGIAVGGVADERKVVRNQ